MCWSDQKVDWKHVIIANLIVSALQFIVPASAASKPWTASATPQDASSNGSLVLVRSWDPHTGQLIGWMPMNQLAIVLQKLSAEDPEPPLNLNDAVTVHFPSRPKSPVPEGEVRIASKVVTQHGKRWLPVDDNVNVVRLGRCLFYIKAIIFGESKWRRPAPPSPRRETVQGTPGSGISAEP